MSKPEANWPHKTQHRREGSGKERKVSQEESKRKEESRVPLAAVIPSAATAAAVRRSPFRKWERKPRRRNSSRPR